MTSLDPQVQIELIEISKEWAEKTANRGQSRDMTENYPKEFDTIYKQLVKTVSEKQA